MTLIQALVLGILQGATEFLPISSSGHLVLVPWLLGWDASGLTFDTTVHLGTLLAVVVYFRQDIWQIVVGVLKTLRDRRLDDFYGRLGWIIAVGSIPAAVLGFLFEDCFELLFGSPAAVAVLLLITGLILFVSERLSSRVRPLEAVTWKDGLLIGTAQAAAIAPGISRSGATIAAGLGMGIHREAAARFSFLMALPIILVAGLFKLKDTVEIGLGGAEMTVLGVGFVAAAVSGYACIHFLLAYVRQRSLNLFAIYCWVFGAFSLVMVLVRGL